MTENQAWNSGQIGRTQRVKDALMRKIRFGDGHWLWCGELGVFEQPILRLGGDAVDAADTVWAAWRGTMPPTGLKRCSNGTCVNPGCRST